MQRLESVSSDDNNQNTPEEECEGESPENTPEDLVEDDEAVIDMDQQEAEETVIELNRTPSE